MSRHVDRVFRLRACVSGSLLLGGLLTGATALAGDADERIAVAVVYDTSGSMRHALTAKDGTGTQRKGEVAARAFGAVIDRLEAFTRGPASKPLSVGIVVFNGQKARVALPLAAFDAAALRTWLANLPRPDDATPLGEAIVRAGGELLAAPAAHRHLLVLTDGANTTGRAPEKALTQLQQDAARAQKGFFTHVIALDLDPATFAGLQALGATVIAAADEAELNARFDFILEEKILVEAP